MKKINLILLVLLVPFISADVLSMNSGGTGHIILNPNEYIEGFFWGDAESSITPVCGNGVIETGETCDDGNTNSGDGCSSTCQAESTGDTGDTGGGGGGGGTTVSAVNVDVSPTSFDIELALNTNEEQTIRVTNPGESTINVPVSLTALSNMILINTTSFTLQPGESKDLDVTFVALSQTGVFTSTIKIGDESIPVTMLIRTNLLLFDSIIEVLNENKQVEQGDKLKAEITMLPMGDPQRLDVTLEYEIKDYNNNVYFTKSETLLIEEEKTITRNFDTKNLPLGKYTIALNLVYPNGVAPSSDQFEVVEKGPMSLFMKIIIVLIIWIIIILIVLLIFLIWKRRKDEEEQK